MSKVKTEIESRHSHTTSCPCPPQGQSVNYLYSFEENDKSFCMTNNYYIVA